MRHAFALVAAAAVFIGASAPGFSGEEHAAAQNGEETDVCEELVRNARPDLPITLQITQSPELQSLLERHPLAELLRCLRKRKLSSGKPVPKSTPTDARPTARSVDTRSIILPRPPCDRAIPTRSEFLQMLKDSPADAYQILKNCNPDVSSLSPLRQLPEGVRQLPEDTRQRPVGTWGN